MNTVLRHVILSILFCIIFAAVLIGVTFLIFPLENWSAIWKQNFGNVSFSVWILGIAISVGTIVGLSIGWYWKQRIHLIERQLDQLVKGQKITSKYDESYREMEGIHLRITQLQEKLRNQAEYAQRLATERANEREQSLQEIVMQERNRLARELHDSVSQQLFAASMLMSAINEANPPDSANLNHQLNMVEKMIHQSQLEMRALLLHLRPIALKGKSLQEGVEELLLELTQKVPMEIESKVESFQVDKGIEDQLFRILQESLSNTLRHSKATTLHVLLIIRDDTVILRVADNGVGFDMKKVKTSSYGMQNMRERAYEVGGTFKVVSVPNEGTRLEVKVPVISKEDGKHD